MAVLSCRREKGYPRSRGLEMNIHPASLKVARVWHMKIFSRDIAMRLFLTCIGILHVCTSVHAALSDGRATQIESQAKSPVTVADSIRMTKLGAYSGRAQFSPDGKKFVIVVKKGNLHENTNQYSLLLWQSAEVFSSPPPTVLLRMSSSSNRPAISAVSWLADSQRIAFLGEEPGELQQLYTYHLRTKQLRKITNQPTNLRS